MKFVGHIAYLHACGRPPRGGRGLKFKTSGQLLDDVIVAPLAGGVD